ncbi:LPS export ABC transporter periplasmic protein LptC [bacterium]|nr:LPS export ABC transporter periplasmic protein LptC [bacterium]
MWKKISIQIVLFLLIIFLVFFTYKIYFKSEENIKVNEISDSQEETTISPEDILVKKNEETPNLINNLKYVSRDISGNEYIIDSKYSALNLENTNVINMEDVNAKIIMLNKEALFVTSKFAIYNNESYKTVFYGDVVISYLDSIINSEKFEIFIKNNFAQVSEKVIYQNLNIRVEADIIEIDLITKNSKIFMIDENKKIKIINK